MNQAATQQLKQPISDLDLSKIVWLLAGMSFPLFCVPWGRLELPGRIHIALPMLLVAISGFMGITFFLVRSKSLPANGNLTRHKWPCALLYFFWLWHALSIMQSVDFFIAAKELLEMTLATFCFFAIIAFFPRDEKTFERFWFGNLITMTIMLAFLIYVFVFIFKAPFLGPEYRNYESPRMGKNDLALYSARTFPFALYYLWYGRRKILGLTSLLIVFVAVIYCISRGGWASAIASIIASVYFLWTKDRKEGAKLATYILIGGGVGIALGLVFISHFVNMTELWTRALSVVAPQLIPKEFAGNGANSYAYRGHILMEAFSGFLTSPIFGVGLTNTTQYVSRITHNDYAAIMLELGAVGIFVFMAILIIAYRRLFVTTPQAVKLNWITVGLRGCFAAHLVASLTFNSYISIYYWSFLALFFVGADIELKKTQGVSNVL